MAVGVHEKWASREGCLTAASRGMAHRSDANPAGALESTWRTQGVTKLAALPQPGAWHPWPSHSSARHGMQPGYSAKEQAGLGVHIVLPDSALQISGCCALAAERQEQQQLGIPSRIRSLSCLSCTIVDIRRVSAQLAA